MSDHKYIRGSTQEDLKVTPPKTTKKSSVFVLKPSTLSSVLKASALSLGSSSFKLQPPSLAEVSPNLLSLEKGSDRNKVESETEEKPAEENNQAVSTDGEVSSEIPKFSFGEKFSAKMTAPVKVELRKREESAFVFGSNLSDKVVIAEPVKESAGEGVCGEEKEEDDEEQVEVQTTERAEEPSTLEESAALQLAKEVKPQLKEVETVTGEENENNVFKVNAKVRVFDRETQNWQDKGCGLLHLNDLPSEANKPHQSRLIVRATGTMRVVLNTMLWPKMLLEKVNAKNVKISAVDPKDGIRIYLVTANPGDVDLIYKSIEIRKECMNLEEEHDEVRPTKRHLDDEEDGEGGSPKRLRLSEAEN